jgi:tetratricopeptide (TPR) repeat protein
LAEKAVAARPVHSFINTLGAALYRAGRFEEAVRRLNESIAIHGGGGVYEDWLFLALSHHRLGHREEARKWLVKARNLLDPTLEGKTDPNSAPLPWNQRVELEQIGGEALALIKP